MAFQGAHRGKIACMPRLLAKTPQKATLPQKPPIWGAPIPPGLNVKAKKKDLSPRCHVMEIHTVPRLRFLCCKASFVMANTYFSFLFSKTKLFGKWLQSSYTTPYQSGWLEDPFHSIWDLPHYAIAMWGRPSAWSVSYHRSGHVFRFLRLLPMYIESERNDFLSYWNNIIEHCHWFMSIYDDWW